VPLEVKTVRFIDNFSTGNRGATSAEYFLKVLVACLHLIVSSEPVLVACRTIMR
jgi:phosphopantothenate-cysteine ligase